jgi:CBS domain-containing protein
MLAKDVMSSPVRVIGPKFPVLNIAALLIRHRIGGLPVMQGDELIGMVTESDLLHRYEIGTSDGVDTRSWWSRILGGDPLPAQYVKSHGRCAEHVMTRKVVFVAESTPLSEIANIFDANGIGRVPVVDEEQRVVGIVTCSDLLKTIAAKKREPSDLHANSDEAIRGRLLAELMQQAWWNPNWSQVFVSGGVVEFRGLVESDAQKLAARVAAENTQGVTAVNDRRVLSAALPAMI